MIEGDLVCAWLVCDFLLNVLRFFNVSDKVDVVHVDITWEVVLVYHVKTLLPLFTLAKLQVRPRPGDLTSFAPKNLPLNIFVYLYKRYG